MNCTRREFGMAALSGVQGLRWLGNPERAFAAPLRELEQQTITFFGITERLFAQSRFPFFRRSFERDCPWRSLFAFEQLFVHQAHLCGVVDESYVKLLAIGEAH